jgi:uncharacterized membrane protein
MQSEWGVIFCILVLWVLSLVHILYTPTVFVSRVCYICILACVAILHVSLPNIEWMVCAATTIFVSVTCILLTFVWKMHFRSSNMTCVSENQYRRMNQVVQLCVLACLLGVLGLMRTEIG